ncbi:MAG: hypothetical protein AAF684_12175, partial [Pseudomonadota bacterium]
MSRLFDRIVIVDWSGAARPATGANAIWIGDAGPGAVAPFNPPTRAAAVAALRAVMEKARALGERLLLGFDFPFGWPTGFAARLCGPGADWRALWRALTGEIRDGDDNDNTAHVWAASANARYAAPGPFWGRPRADAPTPVKKRYAYDEISQWRACERRARARLNAKPKSCWQLAYAGGVGAQALLGVRRVAELRDAAPDGAIWPFETGWRAPETRPGGVVFAEVYPSLFDEAAVEGPKDARQVAGTSAALAARDADGALTPLFDCVDETLRRPVEREEAW